MKNPKLRHEVEIDKRYGGKVEGVGAGTRKNIRNIRSRYQSNGVGMGLRRFS